MSNINDFSENYTKCFKNVGEGNLEEHQQNNAYKSKLITDAIFSAIAEWWDKVFNGAVTARKEETVTMSVTARKYDVQTFS